MLVHENTLTHKRDLRNPLAGHVLRQSGEMPKLPVKNILAKNLHALRTAHETLNTYKRVGDAASLSGSTVERIEKMQSEARIENVEALEDQRFVFADGFVLACDVYEWWPGGVGF